MLQIAPTHWFSWNCTVSDESRRVADIRLNWMREKGVLTIEDQTYRVYREAWMSGAFVIEHAGSVIAQAEKPSMFRRELVIRHAGREYTLRPASIFGRRFVLLQGSRQIGSLTPRGVFTRKAAADLPHDLPLPVRIFIVWLTVISWRREQSS
jgi:hypothetical protein